MKDLKNDLFLRACLREPVERTPIWLMRQAGRYMPEYRELREKAGNFVTFYKDIDLSVKATVLPRKLLGVDASIIFSDILTPLESIGVKFEFREGEGPVFLNPIETPDDILKLKPFDKNDVYYVGEIIKGVNRALNREIPTIGFCGAPFTLAAYMIEGRTSRDFKKAKAFMYNYPDAFKDLLDRLADMLIEYLNFQIESGADAVQIFDSWGGYLSPDDYREFALPPVKKIIKGIKRDYQPVIHFTKGVAGFFDDMITSGADVYSVDWMIDLSEVKEKLNGKAAAQGNLDPIVLYASKDVIREKAVSILNKWGKDTGHIFNLGHGLMPDMEVEKVKYLVDVVKRRVSDSFMELFDLNRLGKLEKGLFVERVNRFTGLCRIGSNIYTCHIADTGRLKEILTEGREIILVKNRPELKTDYRLVSARMEDGWVLVNTSIHSRIGLEAIKKGILGFYPERIKSEVKFGESRIDYLIDDDTFVELKGSNLLLDGRCLFPDAPTVRGVKHINELVRAVKEGYKAYILIMGLRDCSCFSPNIQLDPDFSRAFFEALRSGVKYSGFKIKIMEDGKIILSGKMPLCQS